jgi:cysteine-rich repeat protein
VIQFSDAADAEIRSTMARAGVHLLAPLGANAFFAAAVGNAVDPGRLAAVPTLRSAEEIQRAAKLHPMLATGDIPEHAVVRHAAQARTAEEDAILAAYLLFHGDVDLADAASIAAQHGAEIKAFLRSINGLVVEVPASEIDPLADDDAVQWIEPALPRFEGVLDNARALVQVEPVQAAPYGLDGSGVQALVYDAGTVRTSHFDFGGRASIHDASGLSPHATHVAGILGGNGASAIGIFRGMATSVTLLSYGFEYDGTGIFLYSNPGDLEADYDDAIRVLGADIANNSIGTNVAANGFPCSIIGDYGVTSHLIDTIVRGDASNPVFSQPFRVVWSAGNERGHVNCGTGYGTTAPPAGAKNHITVGAVNSDTDLGSSFSSWGGTDDGRLKPDLTAPGCQASDDFGITSTWSTGNFAYHAQCGTSMAAPVVAGIGSLLIQDYRAWYPGQALFRNSTLKCWLAHTAVDRGTAGPDHQYGYGSVRARAAVDFMRTGQFVEDTILHGASYALLHEIAGGSPELKVTLAWDDFPGVPNLPAALVNDLDLRVYAPSGTRHFPWTLDPADPSAPAVQTQEDHLNNIEQVFVENPEPGMWSIEVHGVSVPEGPQPFSLVYGYSCANQPGAPCDDDGNPCTDDICDGAGQCAHLLQPRCLSPILSVLLAPTCGNAVVEPTEECDDGNSDDGDCCSSTCQFEPVGSPCTDGNFCSVGDTCDGNGACLPTTCSNAPCGSLCGVGLVCQANPSGACVCKAP